MPFEEFRENFSCKDAKIVVAMGEPEYKILLYNKVKELGYLKIEAEQAMNVLVANENDRAILQQRKRKTGRYQYGCIQYSCKL